jgi:hypothetical protein
MGYLCKTKSSGYRFRSGWPGPPRRDMPASTLLLIKQDRIWSALSRVLVYLTQSPVHADVNVESWKSNPTCTPLQHFSESPLTNIGSERPSEKVDPCIWQVMLCDNSHNVKKTNGVWSQSGHTIYLVIITRVKCDTVLLQNSGCVIKCHSTTTICEPRFHFPLHLQCFFLFFRRRHWCDKAGSPKAVHRPLT